MKNMTKRQKRSLTLILIALVLYGILIIAGHTGACPALFENTWSSLCLYLIPFLIVGFTVLKNAVLGIIHGQMFDESFLMSLAAVGAFATGQNSEACAVMIFYQVGELFQSYAVERSRGSIRELMDIAPEIAHREKENGEVETIDPEEVEIGNVLMVKPGEKIPVDGLVLSGESFLHTAALTGESVPRKAKPGDEVISGCINGNGLIKIRAEKCYEDSTVARLLEMVENASEKKSKTENFITRFARVYTPLVVAAAVLLAVIPSLITGDVKTWMYRACTFLVISCPCALVISVPLSFFGGIGAASRLGVLVKGSNYLELLARLDTLVSDKTGTLTRGNFTVTQVLTADGVSQEEVLTAAALAENASTHPIAHSIREAIGKQNLPLPETMPQVENVSGKGIVAKNKDEVLLAGNKLLMAHYHVSFTPAKDPAATVVYVARQAAHPAAEALSVTESEKPPAVNPANEAAAQPAFTYLGAILIRDEMKPEAKEAVSALKELGLKRFVILTGDRPETAAAVAEALGANETYAELLPQDKVAKVESLLAAHKDEVLGFVGDGINDAPVLSRADVGIAMGSLGSDAAIEAADVVIMDDKLTHLSSAMRIARRTLHIARQNIVFALTVKGLILLLGALGVANMWAAVFADVGVAVLCILNAMRLLGRQAKETRPCNP